MNKPLAKSLHTVTVLVRVAKDIQARHPERDRFSFEVAQNWVDAVFAAIDLLGLADMPDDYGLAAQAIKQLSK